MKKTIAFQPMLNEYRSPSSDTVPKLEKAEDLYCELEAFIRASLPPGTPREQALFRLRESEMWTKEGIKDPGLSEPRPRTRTADGSSYVID